MGRRVRIEEHPATVSRLAFVLNEINDLCAQHGTKRVNGKVASLRTQEANREIFHESVRRLYRLGRQIPSVYKLDRAHIDVLVRDWYATGHAIKTMQNQLSRLRRLCEWINKPGMIPPNAIFKILPEVPTEKLKVKTVATKSKSWTENGVNVEEKINEAMAIDVRFGCMLLMGLAFGLRRKEQLRIKPWAADAQDRLLIRDNIAKSGRDRDIEIAHPFQRFVLDTVKRLVKKGEFLGWPDGDFKSNQNRYAYLLGKRLLISGKDSDCVGHGLRAEFAENSAMLRGLIPAVLNGTKKQMPAEQIEAIQRAVSEDLGHGRASVTGAYYGTLR